MTPTPSDLSRTHQTLGTLKSLSVESTDLSIPWGHFMTHCAERQTFIQQCQRVTAPKTLVEALKVACEDVFKQRVDLSSALFMGFDGATFIHGATMTRSFLMPFYYFPDIGVGVLARMDLGSQDVALARLTALSLDPGAVPMGPGSEPAQC